MITGLFCSFMHARFFSIIPGLLITLTLANLSQASDHTNVVIMLADDLGYGSVSWYGSEIPTPHIDSIANNGVGFTSGYMTAPVCNPSRPGFMTGRYQQRWGKEMNSQKEPILFNTPRGSLPLRETTFGTAAKKLGYKTGAFGKWQLGMNKGYHPLDRGFDYFFGMPSGSRFVNPDWPNAHIAPGQGDDGSARSGGGRPRSLYKGRKYVELTGYLTDMLGQEAVNFIDRNKDDPFLIYLGFHAPHTPTQTISKYYNRFGHVDNEIARIYSAQISAVDDWVGAVLAKLREHNLEENTLVIFTSDNGAATYSDLGGNWNNPLIGHKRNLYEGGIRVPYVLQWKNEIEPGQKFTAPVSAMDIFPTALSAIGLQDLNAFKLDGVNLLPHLLGENSGNPHDYLFWRSGHNKAARKGPWKLLISGEDWVRLYNVDEDMSESKDLSKKQEKLVKEMTKALEKWEEDKPPPLSSTRKIKTRFNGDVIEWHI